MARKALSNAEKANREQEAQAKAAERERQIKKMSPEQKAAFVTNERAENFIRLATPRVNKAIKALTQIGQLAGASYVSTPEQVEKVFNALGDAAKKALDKFQNKGQKAKEGGFEL